MKSTTTFGERVGLVMMMVGAPLWIPAALILFAVLYVFVAFPVWLFTGKDLTK